MKNDITILVNSCDSYEDLWYPFFKLLHTYWKDCPYRIILNTESKSYSYDGLNIECFNFYKENEQVPYGERMIRHLKEIETEYTIMLMDDFFIRKEVNQEVIKQSIMLMEKNNNITVCSFIPVKEKYNKIFLDYDIYEERPQIGEYKLNFQAAVWNTSKLLRYWKKHESPWDWETKGNFRTFKTDDVFLSIKDIEDSPLDYDFNVKGMGVYRGKWVMSSVEKLFKENDINIDFSIRGEYTIADKNKSRMNPPSFLHQCTHQIKSWGLGLYLKILYFRIVRQVKIVLKQPVEDDYIKYLRAKYHS